MQVLGEPVSHVAHALNGEPEAFQVVTTQALFYRRLNAHEHTVGGGGRWVAATQAAVGGGFVGDPRHVFGFLGDDLDVGYRGARVLGDDEASAEALQETAEGAQQGIRLIGPRVADDHRLAPAQVQIRHGRLVGHAARQAQHIGERVVVGGVRPHPAAAERGTAVGVVNSDYRLEAGGRIPAVHDLLVAGKIIVIEYRCHRRSLHGVSGLELLRARHRRRSDSR